MTINEARAQLQFPALDLAALPGPLFRAWYCGHEVFLTNREVRTCVYGGIMEPNVAIEIAMRGQVSDGDVIRAVVREARERMRP